VTPTARGRVAVLGAGPAGLATARFLRGVGLEPVLFEQSDGVGGQWHVGAPHSSMWPGMRTNTSRINTAFSDLPHPPGTAAYPRAEQIGAYLAEYANRFDLLRDARLHTRVEEIEPNAHGWRVRSRGADGLVRDESFARVVVATGRHHRPFTPHIAGLEHFTGAGGVSHAAAYRGAQRFRGQRVLVVGHSISAVELASDLALQGAAQVIVAARRHRYVLQRMPGGVPVDHCVYTRAAGMTWDTLPPDVTAAALMALILRTSGHPHQFGAPVYSENVLEAGFTHSPFYLTLVAEQRISTRPWITHVQDNTVHYTDGTSDPVDAIVIATGFALDLPCLGPTARAALQPDAAHLDLHAYTFHPDLPGLAIVGQYEHGGPFFPTLENQARWVAYTFGGIQPMPSANAMRAGVAVAQARRGAPHVVRSHVIARAFARAAGVEPNPDEWPRLSRALWFGPLSPASFRLVGPDALPDAAARIVADAAAFGAMTGHTFHDSELAQLRALRDAGARHDAHAIPLP
jgi:NADPH-dependent 2,4-dienoyl-CoA reductase/sulfur reductase-like enzyme